MLKHILDNGIRVIYQKREGTVTSFCIGLEAGANCEEGYNYGVAHALEHMVFKGSVNYSEAEINKLSDEIFGFNNAMTNYSYVIYYGTCTSEDFERGFKLYSDIIINAKLNNDGFKEEIDVVLQECREWKEDLEQYCEDELFNNAFNKKRIHEIIIGNQSTIKAITIEELRRFYDNYYLPTNMVVSVVSSLDFEEVKNIVNSYLGKFCGYKYSGINEVAECIKSGKYTKEVEGFEGAKLQWIFDISALDNQEMIALKIFNLWFGEGVSSKLFDEIRTKEGLAYEVSSSIKYEKGIKLFSINCSTGKDGISRVLEIVNKIIDDIKKEDFYISEKDIKVLSKRLVLKSALDFERTIVLANRMCIYELMFGDCKLLFEEGKLSELVDINLIRNVIKKVFINGAVQIIK